MERALHVLEGATLVGSYAKRTLFPSDVDLQLDLPAISAARHMQHIVDELVATPLVRVTDVKAGGQHFTAPQVLHDSVALEAALQSPDRVKIDCVAWDDTTARFVEIGCLVIRHDADGRTVGESVPEGRSLEKALEADIHAYAADGDWYKALKRYVSLRAVEAPHEDVALIFNSPLGALGQLVSDLRVIELLCDHTPPRARLMAELGGVSNRIVRCDVTGLLQVEQPLVYRIQEVQQGLLQHTASSVHAVQEAAAYCAGRLNKVLQAACKEVFHRIVKAA